MKQLYPSLFLFGLSLTGPAQNLYAQDAIVSAQETAHSAVEQSSKLRTKNNGDNSHKSGERIFEIIENNLGSLVIIAAGLAALISAAFGAYHVAVGLLVITLGAFIIRSLVGIFFN